MDGFGRLKQVQSDLEAKKLSNERHAEGQITSIQTQQTIVQCFDTLVKYLDNKVTKTNVVNQLQSINTPDALKVIPFIERLDESIKAHKDTDLTELTGVLKELLSEAKLIPKENIELPEPIEPKDYTKQFDNLANAISSVEAVVKAQELIVHPPAINLPAPNVNVEAVDLLPLQKEIRDVVKSVNKIVIPEYKTDNTEVEKLVKKSNELLKKLLDKPVSRGGGGGGRVSPYQDSNGVPAFVTLTAGGKIPVDATVVATIDPTGLATDTKQSDGSQKTQIVDAGGEVATITGGKLDVNASVDTTGLALEAGNLATITGDTTSIDGKTPALGQALAANSVPVILPTATVTTLTPPAAITGFATSAKQLADNHNVTVSNPTTNPETGLAKDATLTGGTQKSQLVDAGGEAATVTGGKLDVNASVDTTGLALAVNQQTDALTDTQLRATAVPISGTVTSNLSATDNAVLDAIASSLAGTLTVTGGGGGVEYTEGDTDVTITGSAIMVEDAANTLQPAQGDKTNGLDVDVTRSALPTGAATSALQLADNHQVTVSNIASTPLVNITTLATSAKQLADGHSVALSATDNAVLDNIDTNTDSGAVVGAGAGATAQRVHLSDEALSALENITVISSGTVTANAGTNLNTSALAVETGGNLASVKTNTDKIPALGQALAANSVPVILPTATISTLTPPAAITGFATSAKQLADNHQVTVSNIASAPVITGFATETTLGTVHGHVDSIDGKTPALGQALAAASVPVILPAATITTLTPPAAITGFATAAKQLADGHTVALSATDNAVLDAIEADTTTIAGSVTGGHVQVDVLSMPAGGSGLTDTELRLTPVPVSGTVTANAGTNLNTSTLAVETGGNLATIKTNTDKIPTLGQALAAASTPVVLTAAQLTTLTPPAQGLTDTQLRNTAVPVSLASVPSHAVTFTGSTDVATQTTLAAINTKLVTGTDIGDVTINNSTGAAAVNIQDGGNTITVDGTVAVTNADIATIAGAVSATHMQADVLTMPTVTVNAHAVTNAGTFAVQAAQATAASLNMTEASASAIKTAVELIDNSVDGNYLNTNINIAGTDVPAGNGTAATSQRVTIASDSTGQVKLAAGGAEIGSLAAGTANIGVVGHNITGIGHGVKAVTTAGTDVVLAASTACKRVIIQAQTDNTSLIAVGGSGVDATVATGTGIILNPGDAFEMDIDNLTDVYIDSLVNGEGVRFTYFT